MNLFTFFHLILLLVLDIQFFSCQCWLGAFAVRFASDGCRGLFYFKKTFPIYLNFAMLSNALRNHAISG